MSKPLNELLNASCEARAVLGSAAGPAAQEKARIILDLALDAITVELAPAKAAKPKKSEDK